MDEFSIFLRQIALDLLNIFADETNLLADKDLKEEKIDDFLLLAQPSGRFLNHTLHRQIVFDLFNSFAEDTNLLADKDFEIYAIEENLSLAEDTNILGIKDFETQTIE